MIVWKSKYKADIAALEEKLTAANEKIISLSSPAQIGEQAKKYSAIGYKMMLPKTEGQKAGWCAIFGDTRNLHERKEGLKADAKRTGIRHGYGKSWVYTPAQLAKGGKDE